ncbi:MAG: hypothetical protein QG670_1629, partial [Thermoproteota archaeon]|nr:hypothetical protein [Thermoproteota archaeon]
MVIELKNIIKTMIVLGMLLSFLLGLTIQIIPVHAASSNVFVGISGYQTSTTQIQNIINTMNDNGMNTYRMCFSPAWKGGSHSYHEEYIQYFIDHSTHLVIVDRNHLYPPNESTSSEARSNWETVENSIFEVLEAFPNNQRVGVELINEYVSSDFYTRMQQLVTEIRNAGYTNPIVINKFSQQWTVVNDPLKNTYQSYHYYFNSWSVSGAISNVKTALAKGIKLVNTEIGAGYEIEDYTASTVAELNQFMEQCVSLGVGNTVWINENLMNWPRYQQLGLVFPTVSPPTQYELHVGVEGSGTTNSTGDTSYAAGTVVSVRATPSSGCQFDHWLLNNQDVGSTNPYSVTMDQNNNLIAEFMEDSPDDPSDTLFEDGYESGSLSAWNGSSITSGETVSVSTSVVQNGVYSGRFSSNGGGGYEKAYASKTVSASSELYARSYFYVSQSGIVDVNDRFFFLIFSSGSNNLAYAGIRQTSSGIRWCLTTRSGTGYVDIYSSSSSAPTTGRWYNVELYWQKDSTNGLVEMWVDGTRVCVSTGTNTAAYGDANQLKAGIAETYGC